MEPLLQVKNLQTYFFTYEGVVKAVDDVTYEVMPGETLGTGRRKRMRQECERPFVDAPDPRPARQNSRR